MDLTVVLVVEDEPLVLLDLEGSLVAAGFEVATASNATQALSAFDADPTRFKAVLTDIKLGDGPNGWDIGRHVREAVPTMPIVYISGDSAPDWHAQGVPESIMISKPFAVAQIITAVASLLNKAPVDLPPTA
jgi:two-component system OmpR family response regulator